MGFVELDSHTYYIQKELHFASLTVRDLPSFYNAFQHVETLFVLGRNLVPSRLAIG